MNGKNAGKILRHANRRNKVGEKMDPSRRNPMKKMLLVLTLTTLLLAPSFAGNRPDPGHQANRFYLTTFVGLSHQTSDWSDLVGGVAAEFAISPLVSVGLTAAGRGDWEGGEWDGCGGWDDDSGFHHHHHASWNWGNSEGLLGAEVMFHAPTLLRKRLDLFAGIGGGLSVAGKEVAEEDDGHHHHDEIEVSDVRVGPFVGARFYVSRRFALDLRLYERFGSIHKAVTTLGLTLKI